MMEIDQRLLGKLISGHTECMSTLKALEVVENVLVNKVAEGSAGGTNDYGADSTSDHGSGQSGEDRASGANYGANSEPNSTSGGCGCDTTCGASHGAD
jgi:hypothetical protein